jgi:NAD(P)-dependent dehydrogenase (short-subunit alcohol dehydrogenase family)
MTTAVERGTATTARKMAPPRLFGPLNPPFATYRDRRVWVIGASYGIGAAIARELIGRGARVALSARKRELLDEMASTSTKALVAPLDITDHASLQKAAERIGRRWGGVDLVLIVAGTHTEMRAQHFRLDDARKLLDVNLLGVLNCIDVALPLIRRAGPGAGIAIFASVAGYVGLPRALIYGASKAALINLTESLYGDLRPEGLGVYLVSPGFVDTPLTKKNDFKMPALLPADEAARITLDEIAAGRFESHYPKRFTVGLKLLRLLPYRLQLWAVRRITGR